MSVTDKLLAFLGIVLAFPAIVAYVWKIANINVLDSFCCRAFGWHKPGKRNEIEGCNTLNTCKMCGKSIMLDSQGNWF